MVFLFLIAACGFVVLWFFHQCSVFHNVKQKTKCSSHSVAAPILHHDELQWSNSMILSISGSGISVAMAVCGCDSAHEHIKLFS